MESPGNYFDLIELKDLMELTSGIPEIKIGLIDGPVNLNHPAFASENIQLLPGEFSSECSEPFSSACSHGTFVAGMFSAGRDSEAPGICPGCSLLVRPIFTETIFTPEGMPYSTPEVLAKALVDCIDAGARIINLSVGIAQSSTAAWLDLEDAINYAAKYDAVVVVAAGNQGALISSALTRHPRVIPVAACDSSARVMAYSNLGISIGKRGLLAPGENVLSLGPEGNTITMGGTSVAAPFVTGTIALLRSLFPDATATEVKYAVTYAYGGQRKTVVPPVLNASAAYQFMIKIKEGGFYHERGTYSNR
jgi:subtilisin family serine protease